MRILYFFLFLFLASCNFEIEKPQVKIVSYGQSVKARSSVLNDVKVDSIKSEKDTIKFYFKNEDKEYFSDLDFQQFYSYTFQDFNNLLINTHNRIKVYYQLPKRDSLGYYLLVDTTINAVSRDLAFFNNEELKEAINELVLLDSSYPYQNILDLLNSELAISRNEILGNEIEFFGHNSFEFLYNYMRECSDQTSKINKEILQNSMNRIAKRDDIGKSVVDDLNNYFKVICK